MLSPTHTLILIQNASFDIYQQPNIMQSFDSNNIIYSKKIYIYKQSLYCMIISDDPMTMGEACAVRDLV